MRWALADGFRFAGVCSDLHSLSSDFGTCGQTAAGTAPRSGEFRRMRKASSRLSLAISFWGAGCVTSDVLLAGRVQGDLPMRLGLAGWMIRLGVAILLRRFRSCRCAFAVIAEMGNIVSPRAA